MKNKKIISLTICLLLLLTFIPINNTAYGQSVTTMTFTELKDVFNDVLDSISETSAGRRDVLFSYIEDKVQTDEGIADLIKYLKADEEDDGILTSSEKQKYIYDKGITKEQYEDALGLFNLFKIFTPGERTSIIEDIESGNPPTLLEQEEDMIAKINEEFPELEGVFSDVGLDLDMYVFVLNTLQNKLSDSVVIDDPENPGKIDVNIPNQIGGVDDVRNVVDTAIENLEIKGHAFSTLDDMTQIFVDQINTRFNTIQMNKFKTVLANYNLYEFTVELSHNADLSDLTVSEGTLIPSFDSDQTSYTVTLPSDYSGDVPTITATSDDDNATVKITPASAMGEEATVVVTAEDCTTENEYTILFVKRFKLEEPTVTVDESTKNIEISDDAVITVPENVENATVKVEVVEVAGKKESTLPKLDVIAKTDIGSVTVEIPKGTIVKGPADWDGTITVPTVKAKPSVSVSGTTSAVIEVGFGDMNLEFDHAVRLLAPGQAGKSAGYIRNGKFTQITTTISADTQEAADGELGDGEEGKVDVVNDLAIWTKHFTEFVTYTPTPSGGGGGGGGGGGAAYSGTKVKANESATIERKDAIVQIPTKAFGKDMTVKLETVSEYRTSKLPMKENTKLLSEVFEITKDEEGNFEKMVTITLPYDKSKVDLDKFELSIYWLDEEKGEWIKLDNVKVEDEKVSGEVKHFTKFAVIATALEEEIEVVVPADVAGHWAEANIAKLIGVDAISGYPDGTFKPDHQITRAEFVTVLVKAFKLNVQSGTVFEDTTDHWAKEYISTATNYGIVSGYDANTFGPNDLITREQMAVMIVKAANLPTENGAITFKDANGISNWAKAYVATAVEEGIVGGYPDNTFKSQGNATRAEAVTVIVNGMK